MVVVVVVVSTVGKVRGLHLPLYLYVFGTLLAELLLSCTYTLAHVRPSSPACLRLILLVYLYLQVMGALMKAHKGEFDGKEANPWVGEMLGKAAKA